MTVYVNMHDSFMSGWGGARGGRSLYCVACDTLAQARAIEKAALARPEMKRVAISEKPRRGRGSDHVRVIHVSEMGGPWFQYMAPQDIPTNKESAHV